MESSILVMDTATVNLQSLQTRGNGSTGNQQEEKFGDVLDDQLQTHDASGSEEKTPMVTQNSSPRTPVVARSQTGAAAQTGATAAQTGAASLASDHGVKDPDTESKLETTAVPEVATATLDAVNLLPGQLPRISTAAELPISEKSPVLAAISVQAQPPTTAALSAQLNQAKTNSAGTTEAGPSQANASAPVSGLVAKGNDGATKSTAQAGMKMQTTTSDGAAQAAAPAAAQEIVSEKVQKLRSTVENLGLEAVQGKQQSTATGNIATALNAIPAQGLSASSHAGFGSVSQADGSGMLTPQALPAMTHPLADPKWNQAFSQRIVWALGQGIQTATLALNPSELGPVTVQISVKDDEAKLQFNALHGQAREAIEATLPRLRSMLQSSGINLAQADVSADAQAQFGHGEAQQQRQEFSAQYPLDGGEEGAVSSIPTVQYISHGLIDTFV